MMSGCAALAPGGCGRSSPPKEADVLDSAGYGVCGIPGDVRDRDGLSGWLGSLDGMMFAKSYRTATHAQDKASGFTDLES